MINSSGTSFTPFPDALSDAGCERLRAVSGSINVYVLDAAHSEIQATHLTKGLLVTASQGNIGVAEGGIFAAIQTVLQGGERAVKGSSRSDTDYIKTAMPIGRLAEPTADLRIPLGPLPDNNLKSVQIILGGKTVYQQATPASEIVLPAANFSYGTTVAWRVTYGSNIMTGQVEVVERARLEKIRVGTAQLPRDDDDIMVRDLREAASLMSEGYRWDAQQAVKRALQR